MVAVNLIVFVDRPAGVGFIVVGFGDLVIALFVGSDCGLELGMNGGSSQGLNPDLKVGEDEVSAIGPGKVALGHAFVADSLEADACDGLELSFGREVVDVVLGIVTAGQDRTVLEDFELLFLRFG